MVGSEGHETTWRGAVDAVKEVHRHVCRGYTDVVDADLSSYFDSIPHDELLKSVARRIVDRQVLRLIKLWLKAPIEERDDGNGTRRIGGGKSNTRGTPQGGVAKRKPLHLYGGQYVTQFGLRGGLCCRTHSFQCCIWSEQLNTALPRTPEPCSRRQSPP
jgi:RNA-directed DNA polymerase